MTAVCQRGHHARCPGCDCACHRVRELHAAHPSWSLRRIARTLDAEGYRPRIATHWSAEQVRQFLELPTPAELAERRRVAERELLERILAGKPAQAPRTQEPSPPSRGRSHAGYPNAEDLAARLALLKEENP